MSPERKPESVDNAPDFETEAIRIERILGVSEQLRADVDERADFYRLTEQERHMLAIELTYFATNPENEEVRRKYYDAYKEAAEMIFSNQTRLLNDLGWRMRWGTTESSINKAIRAQPGNFSFEARLGGATNQLRYVIYNFHNDEILDEQGLCLRKFLRKDE